jgi:nitrile hydratase
MRGALADQALEGSKAMANKRHTRDLSDVELRVQALEAALTAKGLVDPDALDAVIETYEREVGPHHGARLVARAWSDAEFKRRLLDNATQVCGELGYLGPEGQTVQVLENTPRVHNVVVCTLCSCYPWPLLGLPPSWYKSFAYRSRLVREPRTVLAELGLEVTDDKEVRVFDSSAEIRYLVLPERPPASLGKSEEELAAMVTRDGMIGTAAY